MVVRRAVIVVVLGLGLLMFGCAPAATPPTSSTVTTISSSTTFPPTSTTSAPELSDPDHLGLFRADPRTLEPIHGSDPLTTGDALWGSTSPNGEWLVLNVWHDGPPETDLLRVINVQSGTVLSETQVGAPQYGVDIADDGTVYRLVESASYRVEVLEPGTDDFVDLLSVPEGFFPLSFSETSSTEMLDSGHLGWFGTLMAANGVQVAAVGVADPASGNVDLYELPDVTLVGEEEFDVDGWVVGEYYQPGVVWSRDGSEVYVVHADEALVTVVDLTAGTIVEHEWAKPTAWLDRLAAFWNPVAAAKGPAAGAAASAALSPDGQTLYVSSEIGEFVASDDGSWHIEWTPQGIQAIDLATWEAEEWDVPTSHVALTPDGDKLVAWGATRTDTLESTTYTGHPIVMIDTATSEIAGEVDLPYDDVRFDSFSNDGSYVYFTQWDQTFVSLDLSTNDQVGTYTTPDSMGRVFGESGLVAAPLHSEP